ncbi:MAG TPA: tRNA sulfurtransferase [Methanoregulaceae archaeon]|nr:tRNA sulfurtransferase [Methanoregulaceae archaeon]HPD76305.1 tRNA sulfurtransferase [Methanoregulaceae archaeon]
MKCVLVRYGELFLKSDPVKRHFIGLLMRNIKKALDAERIPHRFELSRGRMLLFGDDEERIAAVVARVFGIVDVSVATRTGPDLTAMSVSAVELAKARLRPGMSFAVRTKRQGVAGYTSQQMGEVIGGAVGQAVPGCRVDLTRPDYEIFAEARDIGGFVYDARLPAPGGLPLGTQGKACVLLSSGIDSPVASWLMMKRGSEVIHLHMDGGRWAGPDVRAAAIENHRRLSLWCAGFPLSLLIVESGPVYDAMERARIPPRNRCVICKRFMMMVGSSLVRQQHALGLVTGESLGQVASQTLANLAVIDPAADVPVLRPLLTYDKQETIDIARRIGTFDASPGDLACRAVPAIPATAADPAEIGQYEERIGIRTLAAAAVEGTELVLAKNGVVLPQKDTGDGV